MRQRSREDPGTAGDQAEEGWAEILRNWLPATYRVVTKGRLLFEDGSSSPQVDILVLTPSYPRALGNEKYVFAGGVVAAFECKLILRKADVARAFQTAARIKKKAKQRQQTPYDELNAPPIFGLLAHSQSIEQRSSSNKLYKCICDNTPKHVDHPRELLDLICVADTATYSLGKHVLIGKHLTEDEREELNEIEAAGAVATMYVIQDDRNFDGVFDHSGAILAGLIYELTLRLAFEDTTIRPWAEHLSSLGFYGGIGIPSYCDENVLSKNVRDELDAQPRDDSFWSKWSKNLP
ncbi:DUF6602 domain-containing protein [Bradyrhizobium sp. STM 3557]|uniref:DUF6602 domain-containing protein n=1 Tax=Bradyrhizobium sp. STM 3557 TaxID=578920 RepID=UPI00388E2787